MFNINKWLYKMIHGEKNIITVIHYTVFFTTVDNEKHKYSHFSYVNPNSITCSIPEYLMIFIKKDGYIEDDAGAMYPLQNIISIKWTMDSTINVIESNPYEVFYYSSQAINEQENKK